MSFITFQCYACNHLLKVGGDKAGRKAKCNKCGTILTIPVASTAAPPSPESATMRKSAPPPLPAGQAPTPMAELEIEEDVPTVAAVADDDLDEDYESPRKQQISQAAAWSWVRLGLLLVFIGVCVLAGAFVLELVGYLLLTIDTIRQMTSTSFGGGTGNAPLVLLRIATLVDVGAAITATVGYVFCLLGPNKRGTLGLAIATTAVTGVYVILALIFKVWSLFGSFFLGSFAYGFGTWFGMLLCQILFSAELILFPLYLRALCFLLKSSKYAKVWMQFMILACFYAGERVITFIFLYITTQSVNPFNPLPKALIWITLVLLWIGAFIFLGQIIWYPILLWRTRAKVT